MNKKTLRIAGWALGLSMAVAGIGAAVESNHKTQLETKAGNLVDTYVFTASSWSSKLNGEATAKTTYWTVDNVGNGYSSTQGLQFTTNNASDYIGNVTAKSYFNVSSIVVTYSTNASKGAGTIKTQVGTGTAQTFAVTKPSSGGTTDKTTEFSFSGETGAVGLYVTCSANSVYIKQIAITYEETPAAVLTGLRIASGSPNKLYEPGQAFDGTGLTVYASWDDEEDDAKNVLSDIVWNNGATLSLGLNQTVTGYHKDDSENNYPIQVTGVDVKNADVLLNGGENKPAGVSSSTNTNTGEGQVASAGVKYGYYALQTYSGNLEFNRSTNGAYLGNKESYGKYIRRIVVTLTDNSFSKLTMYEGVSSIPGSSSVTGSGTGTTRYYDFDDGMEYFALKLTTTGTWVQITSVKVFLGETVPEAIATSVEIATPGSVYVGKTLQLSATVSYSNKADDNRVTWAVSSGSGATVDDSGLVTAIAPTATTITATTVADDNNGEKIVDSVIITPLANPITSVAFDTSKAKTEYIVGEPLNISGITATGTHASGDSESLELSTGNFSGFDSSTPANSQVITITYGGFSTTYTISVVQKVALTSEAIGSFEYGDTKTTGIGVSINTSLDSKVDIKTYGIYKNAGMQMNTGKGTYFKNVIAVPGRITRLVMTWKASGKNSPTVYFGSSYIGSKPASGGTQVANNVTTHTLVPATDSYYFFIDGTTVTGACVMTNLEVFYEGNDIGNAKNFADNFLHMNDYDPELNVGEEGQNYCLADGVGDGKGYFDTAASAYALLGDNDKTEFKKLGGAVARFEAWASANQKVIDLNTGAVSPTHLVLLDFGGSIDSNLPLIITIASGSLVAAGGIFLLSRRRRGE